MGVTYKLTDDIVQYIVAQKQQEPGLSLRELVDLVSSRFQIPVSKSSVHDVLKEAHISSPRGRKAKNKFEIPAEKKAQLLANIPVIVPAKPKSLPANPADVKPAADYRAMLKQPPDILKPLQPGGPAALTDILFQAAFYDLFPAATAAIRYEEFKTLSPSVLARELPYRSTMVAGYRLTLEDGAILHIDARFKSMSLDQAPDGWPAPIERALSAMSDRFLGDAQTTVINMVVGVDPLAAAGHFMRFMQGKRQNGLNEVMLIGPDGSGLAEFAGVPGKRGDFSLGIEPQVIPINEFTKDYTVAQARGHCVSDPIRYMAFDYPWEQDVLRGFALLNAQDQPDRVILSNVPRSVPDGAVIRQYCERGGGPGTRSADLGSEDHENKQIMENSAQEQVLRRHVTEHLFRKRFPEVDWMRLAALSGELRCNDRYLILDVAVPDDPELTAPLTAALDAFNGMALTDGRGRLMHIALMPEKIIPAGMNGG